MMCFDCVTTLHSIGWRYHISEAYQHFYVCVAQHFALDKLSADISNQQKRMLVRQAAPSDFSISSST